MITIHLASAMSQVWDSLLTVLRLSLVFGRRFGVRHQLGRLKCQESLVWLDPA